MGTGIVLPSSGGGSGTAGLIDLSSVTGLSDKVNLTSVTTQSRLGYGFTFKAGSALSCGQPVIYNYASGVASAITAGTLPSEHEVIGIALEDTVLGASVNVLTQGFVTARRDTTFAASSETVLLNSITNNTTRNLTNNTSFLDSGNSGADYQNNETWQITFDAQVGYTVDVVVNDIEYEAQGSTGMYDKLGIQGSNDGVNFVNLSVSWLQRMATTTYDWGTSFAGSSFNSASSLNGWVFPSTTTRAILLGSGTFPTTINTGYRYIKFRIATDSSVTQAGWDMTLQPNTPYITSAQTVAEGTTLYLDNVDYSKISTDPASGIIIGYAAYDNAENDSIFIRLR